MSLAKTKEAQAAEATSAGSRDAQDAVPRRFHAWSSIFWQFFRYCLVGGVNTLVDVLVLNVFLWRFPTHNAQVLVAYNSIAYAGGAVSSFYLNKYWTFGRKQRPTRREVVRFVISLLLEVLASNALVWLAGKALQPLIANPTLWGNAAKLVAVVVGTIISYAFMRFWIFATDRRHTVGVPATTRRFGRPQRPQDVDTL